MNNTKFKLLGSRLLGKYLIKKNMPFYLSFKSNRWGGVLTFGEEIERNCNMFLTPDENKDQKLKDNLTVDMLWSYYRYGAVPIEYFLMDFMSKKDKQRQELLTVRHKDTVMIEKVGMGDNWELLENKYLFYQRFGKFFKRDVLCFDENTTLEQLELFCKKHHEIIIKPVNGQCGRGIELVSTDKYNDIKELFDYLLSAKISYLLEEKIIQDERMAKLNPSSVNTVRLPSFINSKGFYILKPCLRMGRKGSIVDNGASGGIIAVIDENTGKIVSDGRDELGQYYINHPDSNQPIKGFQVPCWEELLSFAEKIHREISYYPYVGWDFAFSKEKGWMLIEGNWGQFLSELVDREGIKRKFDAMFD